MGSAADRAGSSRRTSTRPARHDKAAVLRTVLKQSEWELLADSHRGQKRFDSVVPGLLRRSGEFLLQAVA